VRTNGALEAARLAYRVDPCAAEQRAEPVLRLPENLFYHERNSGPNAAGDALHATFQDLVSAYAKKREAEDRRKGARPLA
jgi:hypothetical protein